MTAFQAMAKIPGPTLHPILGWRGLVLDFARDPVDFLTSLHDQHGRIARRRAGEDVCHIHLSSRLYSSDFEQPQPVL